MDLFARITPDRFPGATSTLLSANQKLLDLAGRVLP